MLCDSDNSLPNTVPIFCVMLFSPNVDRLPPVLLDLKPQTWKNFHPGGQQSIIVILLLKRVPMGLLLLQIDTGHYILNN